MSTTEFPSVTDFLLNEPMYEETPFEGEQTWNAIDLLYHPTTYDSYCPKCGKETTFQIVAPALPDQYKRNIEFEQVQHQMGVTPNIPALEKTVYQVVAQCARQSSHLQRFLFLVDARVLKDMKGKPTLQHFIQKIGQYPSFADLNLYKVKRYSPVLSRRLLGELNRAIGLASHDVGVGAYTYLRRVFEALIEEAHQIASASDGWDEEAFLRSRMAERIALLKSHLPSFLVEHPGMYALLSKGIHELTEDECLEHFHTLRIAIELILDENLERHERKKKISEAKKALTQAIGKHA